MKAKDLKGKLINSEVQMLKHKAHIHYISSTLMWHMDWTEYTEISFKSSEQCPCSWKYLQCSPWSVHVRYKQTVSLTSRLIVHHELIPRSFQFQVIQTVLAQFRIINWTKKDSLV